MNAKVTYINGIFLLGAMVGCKQQFLPPTTAANANILVVDGFINVSDSTIVNLSRTVIVANKSVANPETKATLTIENAQGIVATLTETVKGSYVTPKLTLDNTKQYRLRIKTSNGKTYVSDLTDVRISPPIDSIGYKATSTGLQIYLNTHDATNKSRYYKYNYRETWAFSTFFGSGFTGNGVCCTIVGRTPAQMVNKCFGSDSSANITLNSTIQLSQDVVYQKPITTIDTTSEKIETRYSILVSQQVLTKDAYDFWTLLQKNTEQLGSIFDAQPSQTIGNIHNVNDASEPVIGYISVGTIQKKRIFIDKTALPARWHATYPYQCTLDSAYYVHPGIFPPRNDIAAQLLYLVGTYAITPFTDYGGGWQFATAQCADCTIRGDKQQPSYWK